MKHNCYNQLISESYLENIAVSTEMKSVKSAGSASYSTVDAGHFLRLREYVFKRFFHPISASWAFQINHGMLIERKVPNLSFQSSLLITKPWNKSDT